MLRWTSSPTRAVAALLARGGSGGVGVSASAPPRRHGWFDRLLPAEDPTLSAYKATERKIIKQKLARSRSSS